MTSSAAPARKVQHKSLVQRMADNWQLYVLLIIPVVITIVYKYGPMYGIQIAFRNYNPGLGITGSPWAGWKWFERFFRAPNFDRMLWNTIKLSLFSLLWGFPVPIILSLALNQLRFMRLKRTVQTVIYAPHFISTMVICGMLRIFLSPSGGLINLIAGTKIDFLTEASAFRTIYVASGIWQEAGWGTIIYLAALTGISPELYEAAAVDGAGRFKRIWHVTLPGLRPTIITLLIMNLGRILGSEFDRPLALSNKLVTDVSQVISIYVYQNGLKANKFALTTAVGLFQSVVGVVFLIGANALAKRFGERGIM